MAAASASARMSMSMSGSMKAKSSTGPLGGGSGVRARGAGAASATRRTHATAIGTLGGPDSVTVSAATLSRLGVTGIGGSTGGSGGGGGGGGAVNPKDTVVIHAHDLVSIREAAVATSSQRDRERSADLAKERSLDKARARKEKMLHMERERLKHAPQLTEAEEENKHNREVLLGRAKTAMEEEHDDVKHMKQMIQYAKCVSVRDAQIIEKKKIEEDLLEEDKRLDTIMEVERVRQLKLNEEKEALRAQELKVGAAVLIRQMEERQADRIRRQELREQDAQAMVQRIKELEEKEEEERVHKVAAGRRMLEQVQVANNEQARSKLRKKQEEIDEDLRIAEYNRLRELREAEQEADALRQKDEKEKEVARLRAQQERAQDRQSAIDELRAKRYQEQKDRKWRKEQMDHALKREAMKGEIAQARDMQRSEKSRRMAEQALQEREEYVRVLDWQRTQGDIDSQKLEEAKTAKTSHREHLLAQMREHTEVKAEARAKFLAEGQELARKLEADKRRLHRIKDDKLDELDRAGVPHKYRAELAKKKLMVSSIHPVGGAALAPK